MKICFDFTRVMPTKGKKYHGGSLFAYNTLIELAKKSNTRIIVFFPRGYEALIEKDDQIRSFNNVRIDETTSIYDEDMADFDVLFMPLIDGWNIPKLVKLKRNNPRLYIVVTIHEMRFKDLCRFDRYGYLYYSGSGEYLITQCKRIVKWMLSKKGFKSLSDGVDYVITVSNYSLQEIVKYSKPNRINYIYQYVDNVYKNDVIDVTNSDAPFILFVSGGREEKNFIRGLKAYIAAVKLDKTMMKLVVTGVNEEFKERVFKHFRQEMGIISDRVEFYDYVEEAKMQSLYRECAFLLYTSWNEGFGLPVLNAAIYGKPAIASWLTSVPEVTGTAGYYVNPYDVDSIKEGIMKMSQKDIRAYYEQLIADSRDLIMSQMELGKSNLANIICNR